MNDFVSQRSVHCPYCGEPVDLVIDCSAEDHAFNEDCPACCKSIEVQVQIGNAGNIRLLTTQREDG